MAAIVVARYYCRWDLKNGNGRIILYSSTNDALDSRTYSNPEEFQLIVDMLRNEKPLWYNDDLNWLQTGSGESGEPTGEEET